MNASSRVVGVILRTSLAALAFWAGLLSVTPAQAQTTRRREATPNIGFMFPRRPAADNSERVATTLERYHATEQIFGRSLLAIEHGGRLACMRPISETREPDRRTPAIDGQNHEITPKQPSCHRKHRRSTRDVRRVCAPRDIARTSCAAAESVHCLRFTIRRR